MLPMMKSCRLQSQQNFVKTKTLQLLVDGRSFAFWQCTNINSSLRILWDYIPRLELFSKLMVFFRCEESNFITKVLIDVLVVCVGRRQTRLSEYEFLSKNLYEN